MIVSLNSDKLLSISDFFRTLQAAIAAEYGKDKLTFTAAYPLSQDDYQTPIVTYHYRQFPGTFSNTKELKPRHSQDINVDTKDGPRIVSIFRQRFEYTITFEVWHHSGLEADNMAEAFRKYLTLLLPYFKALGLQDMIFTGLDGTQPEQRWRTDLVRRELTYHVVLDEITSATTLPILAFNIGGFVYKSIYHLLEQDGTPINSLVIEAPSTDTSAAITPDAADVSTGTGDSIVIQLN
jgi:hypothetical protein